MCIRDIYKHVPSVTNFPVYVGALDELLEPFIDDVDEAQAKKMLKLFMQHIDRTVLDSFSHANIEMCIRDRSRAASASDGLPDSILAVLSYCLWGRKSTPLLRSSIRPMI